MWRLCLSAALAAASAGGCAVQQLRDDQDKIRCALLELYTNQIMDNLIRASNGLPIIHLDYTNATAQVTVTASETVGDTVATTYSSVTNNSLAPTTTAVASAGLNPTATASSSAVTASAATGSVTGTVTGALTTAASASLAVTRTLAAAVSRAVTRTTLNTASGSSTATNANQVALTATPVTTSNEVYDAYLYYLTLPDGLLSGDAPPPPGTFIVSRKAGGRYYWIPAEKKKEFLALSLATTAQRGKPVPAPTGFEVTLVGPVGDAQPVDNQKDLFLQTVRLDKPIPNDSGRVEFADGTSAVFDQYQPAGVPAPATTDRVTVYVDLQKKPLGAATLQAFRAAIANKDKPVKATFFVRNKRPEAFSTADLLNRLSFQLQQIQFNQMR